MSKILGLDLGTNSIGWAVVETENNKTFSLKNKGVRIFQEGVKIEKGVEGSKAAERTGYRSARRLKFRRKLRKIEVLKALIKYDLCPPISGDELNIWRYKKIYPTNKEFRNWWLTDNNDNRADRKKQTKNPYYYRSKVATDQLDLTKQEDRYILGRAFYHMAQRRGFLSNRLENTKESDGAVTQNIKQINQQKGDLTLGQYFYQCYCKGEKIRNQYTDRLEHYEQEFNHICKLQGVSDEQKNTLHKAIFYQRPLKSQKGLIGKCPFEPKKSRVAISHPAFEEYRMLCFVNSIKIKLPEDDKLRFLTEKEREKIIPVFYRKSKPHFDFEDIAKQLAPAKQYKFYKAKDKNPEDYLFNFNMKTTVSGCPVSARLKSIFGDEWKELQIKHERKDHSKSIIDIYDVWHVLMTYDSEDKLFEFAKCKLGLGEDKTKEFVQFNLPQGYGSLSLKAINKILPFLQMGLIYSHAVFLANMANVIPPILWNDPENKQLIINEIKELIQSQNEEKQITDIVNGLIKINKDSNAVWSNEAERAFKNDLLQNIKAYYGSTKFDSFSIAQKSSIETNAFELLKTQMQKKNGVGEFAKVKRIDERIKDFLIDNFNDDIKPENLYHPSAIETFKPAQKNNEDKYLLGSPITSSVRNPMAMRALHQLRKLINQLINDDVIDEDTIINIEMARDLMNANERKALQNWQRRREDERKKYAAEIVKHYKASGINAEPSNNDILKYQLWEEQNHICLYTGKNIALHQFLGSNPEFDIEHTIPQSLSFDNSQVNITLCDSKYNRTVKRNKIPYELNNPDILLRIHHWKKEYENIDKDIQKCIKNARGASTKEDKDRHIIRRHQLTTQRNYIREKYQSFTRKDVPSGFKNSQLVDIGLITKYARLYLKTVFDRVNTVKGTTVADFRKLWGLQNAYETKARVNHIHHCIDAITIACMTKPQYDKLAKFYHDWECLKEEGVDKKPVFEKPWPTFTEDVKGIENEILISHYTPDSFAKQSKKLLRKRGIIQKDKNGNPIVLKGDTVRGSLHKETFYGAIERTQANKKGELEKVIKYVVRKKVSDLSDTDVKNIVDDRIREIVGNARNEEKKIQKEIERLKKDLQKAEEHEEPAINDKICVLQTEIEQLYSLPNKKGAPIPIKKVRLLQPSVTNPLCIKKQRDVSTKKPKEYKQNYYAANDGNYLMAIYEGKDAKGKIKRDFEIVNNITAGEFFKQSVQGDLKPQGISTNGGLIPKQKENGKLVLPYKSSIKIGTMIILWEKSPTEVFDLELNEIKRRLYKVVGLSAQKLKISGKSYNYATIVLRHHQEASSSSDLKTYDGAFKRDETYMGQRKLNHNQFNALVENIDFDMNTKGTIKWIKH